MTRKAHSVQKRVVVVDDEAIVCEALRQALEHDGFSATAIDDGRRAMEVIHEQKPDLVVLDLYMPGVDGREIARAIKSHPDTKQIRILMLTGSSEAVDVVTGLDAGAADYVAKPIGTEELIAKIRRMLGLPPSAPRPKF